MELIDDRHEILSLYTSDCAQCRLFTEKGYKCKAFPESIPSKILSGEVKHRKVLPTQEGKFIFTPK